MEMLLLLLLCLLLLSFVARWFVTLLM